MAQPKKSPEQLTSDILTALDERPPQPRVPLLPLIGAVLLVALVFLVLTQTTPQPTRQTDLPRTMAVQYLVTLPLSNSVTQFVRVAPGEGGRNDIYLYSSAIISDPINLTKSPAIDEVWPVPDSNGEHVAYYGINGTGVEVYLLHTDRSRAPLPLTVRAGNSALHNGFEITPTLALSFSPSQTWVAFPARSDKGDVVEVFIAQTDGQQVVRATTLNQQVIDYIWLDDNTLAVTYRSPDSTLHSVVYPLNSSGMPFATLTP
jgi:hypothetical protein